MERTTLIAATDLHYIAPELTDHGPYFQQVIENADGKITQYSEELTEAFLSQVIDASPAVLIFFGDLTFNGAEGVCSRCWGFYTELLLVCSLSHWEFDVMYTIVETATMA